MVAAAIDGSLCLSDVRARKANIITPPWTVLLATVATCDMSVADFFRKKGSEDLEPDLESGPTADSDVRVLREDRVAE